MVRTVSCVPHFAHCQSVDSGRIIAGIGHVRADWFNNPFALFRHVAVGFPYCKGTLTHDARVTSATAFAWCV